jgi:hypothetical protein
MGNKINNHQIYETINNDWVEHQSTMVESSGKINNANIKILFDYGAINSFIS